jgi:hypothetical protein
VGGQVLADLAQAGHADLAAVQRRRTPAVLGGGAHALEDAPGGEDRGVARAAVLEAAAGDVGGLAGDDVHVLHVGADVASGPVAAVERLHEAPVCPQQRLGLVTNGVAPDHGLAAAEVEPGESVLVRHPPRQLQHVVQSVFFAGVRVEAGAAERGAQRGGVETDDGFEPGCSVLAEDNLFVAGVGAEDAHGNSSLSHVPL